VPHTHPTISGLRGAVPAGRHIVPDCPGIGIDWNEKAVKKYLA